MKQKRLRGTLRKHRERKHEPGSLIEPAIVGAPPVDFTAKERAVWRALGPQVAPTFTERDREAFELLCRLRAKLENPRLPAHVFSSLSKSVVGLLEKFGAVPSARDRVPVVERDEADVLSEAEMAAQVREQVMQHLETGARQLINAFTACKLQTLSPQEALELAVASLSENPSSGMAVETRRQTHPISPTNGASRS